MAADFLRETDFPQPLDEMWEVVPQKHWSFETGAGGARLANTTSDEANIYLRPCSIYGDSFSTQWRELRDMATTGSAIAGSVGRLRPYQ